MAITIMIPLIVAIVGAFGAYLAAVKRLSGSISTSTAEDLWQEGQKMRRDMLDRIHQQDAIIRSLQHRVDQLMEENIALTKQVSELQIEIEQLGRWSTDGGARN